MICGDTPTYGWVYRWLGGWVGSWVGSWLGSCQIIKYQINLNLIKIIQFCLKIYDLWRHPTYGWEYGWLGGLMDRLIYGVMSNHLKSNKSLCNWDNSIANLWFVETHPTMGGCMCGLMGGSMGGVGSNH